MLKLKKLQYFGPLKQRVDILENTLMLEKIENGATENEMVGWHYRLNEHEFEQNMGDSEEQESLAHCSLWGCKEPHVTWLLNNHNPLL